MSKRTERERYEMTDSHCTFCGKDLLGSLDDFITGRLTWLVPEEFGGSAGVSNKYPCCGVCAELKHGDRGRLVPAFNIPDMKSVIEIERKHREDWRQRLLARREAARQEAEAQPV